MAPSFRRYFLYQMTTSPIKTTKATMMSNMIAATFQYLSKACSDSSAFEQSLIPWESAYDKINTMGRLLQNSPSYSLFRKYVLDLVKDHYERLKFIDEG